MFACRVCMHLKPSSTAEFIHRLENEVIPFLRKQEGFQDEVTFIAQDETTAFGISLWDNAESAKGYNRRAYPEVAKILSKVVNGIPRVETYEISNAYEN